MDNLIVEANAKLEDVVSKIESIKNEYEKKIEENSKEIEIELAKVDEYKDSFYASKEKIQKMSDDITGFEEDYKNLVAKFKDDELSNILIGVNKEISNKIEEKKRKIIRDKQEMNDIVDKANEVKKTLVKLNAEKKALQLCLDKINDTYIFYSTNINELINYSKEHKDNLSNYNKDENVEIEKNDNNAKVYKVKKKRRSKKSKKEENDKTEEKVNIVNDDLDAEENEDMLNKYIDEDSINDNLEDIFNNSDDDLDEKN
ncbi:MAG TPA: hypothetical protein PLB45_03500 [Bacilli bacterium]|nr:hypothetical protein [Bacilli bacterium]